MSDDLIKFKDIILLPIILQLRDQFNMKFSVDDFEIEDVLDSISHRGHGPIYSGEKRCIYDAVTIATPGLRIRGYYHIDRILKMGKIKLDRHNANNFDEDRTMYTMTIRMDKTLVSGLSMTRKCPKAQSEVIDDLNILLDEQGYPILQEDDQFIYL